MIDDHIRNLEVFRGKPLLFTASHNVHETRFIRVNDWHEVRQFFRKEKERQ
jgi:5'(3')-deoxyribonucleotidase